MSCERRAIPICALLILACGEPEVGLPDAGDPTTIPLTGPCELSQRIGGFVVEARATDSSVGGAVANGVAPLTVLEETLRDGECRLLRRNPLFCDPPCAGGTTCDHGGDCIEQPTHQDLGQITIDGLQDAVVMAAIPPGNNYFDTTLPHPVFAADDVVHLHSTGGAYEALSLYGIGGQSLETSDDTWLIVANQPLPVTWGPPSGENIRTSVWMHLSIDQHGSSPLRVECVFADDGEGVVSGALTGALIGAGVTGFPHGGLSRSTVDKQTVLDGCVDLTVALPRQHAVRVDGHTPCETSTLCPDEFTCDPATQTCVPTS